MEFRKFLENHVSIPVVHGTTPESLVGILKNGFSLQDFGRTAKITKQLKWLELDPEGIYFIRAESIETSTGISSPAHPFNFQRRGVWVFAQTNLQSPLEIGGFHMKDGNLIGYKEVLKDKYGLHGRALTQALQQEGYDGIVTDGEIVVFDPKDVIVDHEKTKSWLKTIPGGERILSQL